MVNQADIDYNMLTTYLGNLESRVWLLRIDFDLIKDLLIKPENYKIAPGEKIVTYAIAIQINIISKIMMLIEDFVVIANSFLIGKNFYQNSLSPGSPDLGPFIRGFLENDYSDDEILSIMNWIDTKKVTTDNKIGMILDKFLENNISYTRKFMKELRMFRNSNHPLYRRFKHGGSPINSDSGYKPSDGLLRDFEAFSLTSVGPDPFSDPHIIPFSMKIVDKYSDLVKNLKEIINEMIRNRIESLQREICGVVPNLNNSNLSSLDPDSIASVAIQNFYDDHPLTRILKPITYNVRTNVYEKIPWYLE